MGLGNIIKGALEFFYGVTGSYGLAIILLTLVVRAIMFPLTWRQAKAMEEMKFLQPKMKQLQEKYKDKPQEYQKRVVELYREHRINPLSGCWPYLVQFPVIIALFNVLRTYQFGEERFLWLMSMGRPDPVYVLPLLAGFLTFVQGRVLATDPSQSAMNYIMPLFITWISIGFPAGVTLYWVMTSLLSVVEQKMSRALMKPLGQVSPGDVRGSVSGKERERKDDLRGEARRDEGDRKDGKDGR